MAVFKFRNLKSGQATPIPPGEFTVGRADDAYVHLEDGSVSRRHAQVINNASGFFIEDLGSANGTAARGSYITRRMNINYGDVVYIGSVPFRIDPEVAGDVDAAPSAGMRSSNRAYIRRDTERLPKSGELPRVVEKISPDKLSAPEVSAATDIDAGELNAVIIHEPENVSEPVRKHPEPEPAVEVAPPRSTFSAPAPSRAVQLQAPHPAVSIQAELRQPAFAATPPVQETPARTATGWGWLLLTFLAGMGAGLLIGLSFARLFIEMGGKAASLP
ncbi:MAG TPA: FHA domain-containing protein [Candidatus Methylacidiphilales bacterium]